MQGSPAGWALSTLPGEQAGTRGRAWCSEAFILPEGEVCWWGPGLGGQFPNPAP